MEISTKGSLRIVHVPRRFVRHEWGGTETVILETCKALRALGHRSEVLCPRALAENDYEDMDGLAVRRVPYFYPYLGLSAEARLQLDKKGGNMFSFALMRELQRMPDLDVIHLHTGNRVGGIARRVAQRRRIPYVVTLHGGVYDMPKHEADSLIAPTQGAFEWGKALGWWVGSRNVLRDAGGIICISRREEELTRQRYPGRPVHYLPNGVDTQRFAQGDGARFREAYGIPPTARLALTVARFDPQKNQQFLVRLLPRMREAVPNTHLLMVGAVTNDNYYRELRRMVVERGLEDCVTTVPGLPAGSRDLPDAYHAADLFVLPSRHEPFGIVILEAWAAGLPVIASRIGGIPAFVEDGRDAVLFEPDGEDMFLDAFRAWAADPGRAQALAEAGKAKACGEYSWERVTGRLVDIYREAIERCAAERSA